MKAGKPTELPSSPLDTLSPGPAFDKAAAWNNLQQRLEEKKTRILFPWQWAAAAVLLICCTILLWPAAKKDIPIVKTNNGKKNPAPEIQTGGTTTTGTSPQAATATHYKTNSTVTTAALNSIRNSSYGIKPVKDEVHVTDSFDRITTDNQSALTLSAEPAAIKKKLRVVYNNDLAVADPEEVVAAAEETENPIPLFRKARLNHTLKAENTQPEDNTPRRKKGILFFNPSIKPKD